MLFHSLRLLLIMVIIQLYLLSDPAGPAYKEGQDNIHVGLFRFYLIFAIALGQENISKAARPSVVYDEDGITRRRYRWTTNLTILP